MSVLKANKIAKGDGTLETSTDYITQGSAKSFTSWNGKTAIIKKSLNVSSLVDHGTGDFEFGFVNNFVNADYCIVCSAGDGAAATYPRVAGPSESNPTVSHMRITTYYPTSTNVDMTYSNAAVLGDLA